MKNKKILIIIPILLLCLCGLILSQIYNKEVCWNSVFVNSPLPLLYRGSSCGGRSKVTEFRIACPQVTAPLMPIEYLHYIGWRLSGSPISENCKN